jgi:predicted phage baseplate assembly protein
MLEIADGGATSLVFGDGVQGARLPTGAENVKAVFRSGIGRGGNVGAETLTTLLDRPLGLKEVRNPLPAGGGADPDGPEEIRRNVPLPLRALDGLVSVSDYAAFSRAFAGIGKAEAAIIRAAGGTFVHVTVAGQADAPLEGSALVSRLTEALVTLGDPTLPVRVQPREMLVLLLAARVAVEPDYAWVDVEPAVRAALVAAFGFDRRQPGEDVFLSEVITVMQRVPGVSFVDVDSFGGVPEKKSDAGGRRALKPEELEAAIGAIIDDVQPRIPVGLASYDKHGQLRPAQLALFLRDMPETLILNLLES